MGFFKCNEFFCCAEGCMVCPIFFGKVIGLYGYTAIRLKGYVVMELRCYPVIIFW
jgi:hypothetical protein